MDRTAFKEMTFNGAPPGVVEPEGNAAANVAAIRREILSVFGVRLENAA